MSNDGNNKVKVFKSFSQMFKEPGTKKEVVKFGFAIAGGVVAAAQSWFEWNARRKATKKDKLEAEERKKKDKDEEREKELEHAQALEDIKTAGYEERIRIRKTQASRSIKGAEMEKRDTPSESSTLPEIDQRVGELPEAIIPGALFPGDMCTLAGENHSGKSLLLYHIGLRLAQAKPINLTEQENTPTTEYDVLIYDRENSDSTLKKRYGSINVPNLKIIRGEDYKDITDILVDLELQLKLIHPNRNVLVCIDNASAYNMPTSGARISNFYVKLQSIIDKAKEDNNITLTVIIAVHLSAKKESGRSSSKVLGATQMISGASANWYIKNTRFGKVYKLLKVEKNRIEDWPEQAFLLRINGDTPVSFAFDKMIDEADACPLPEKEYRTITISHTTTEIEKHDSRCSLTKKEIEDIIKRKEAGERVEDLAKEKEVSMKTVYKWIKEYKKEHSG